jgi:CRP-like cAMP-binding protein
MPIRPREFLQALTADERRQLVSLGTTQLVEEDYVLMERGEEADRVLVVLSGSVAVLRDGERLATRGPGSLIGEMSIVDHRPRSATVVAAEPSEILSIPANAFRSFLAQTAHAAMAVIEQLGRRLREADRR